MRLYYFSDRDVNNLVNSMNLAAVIVETRPLANLKQVIENHLKFLPEYTKLYIFGSDQVDLLLSQAEFQYIFCDIGNVINERNYNTMLTATAFWNYIEEENILLFQHDSEILRSGIEEFYDREYVGAPWKFQSHGGNGGLSFRKKAEMIKAIENHGPYNYERHGNEDVFFSNALYQTHSHYNKEACKRFSCETIFELGTFGCHAIDKYLTPEQCSLIRNQYKNNGSYKIQTAERA